MIPPKFYFWTTGDGLLTPVVEVTYPALRERLIFYSQPLAQAQETEIAVQNVFDEELREDPFLAEREIYAAELLGPPQLRESSLPTRELWQPLPISAVNGNIPRLTSTGDYVCFQWKTTSQLDGWLSHPERQILQRTGTPNPPEQTLRAGEWRIFPPALYGEAGRTAATISHLVGKGLIIIDKRDDGKTVTKLTQAGEVKLQELQELEAALRTPLKG